MDFHFSNRDLGELSGALAQANFLMPFVISEETDKQTNTSALVNGKLVAVGCQHWQLGPLALEWRAPRGAPEQKESPHTS